MFFEKDFVKNKLLNSLFLIFKSLEFWNELNLKTFLGFILLIVLFKLLFLMLLLNKIFWYFIGIAVWDFFVWLNDNLDFKSEKLLL